MMVWPRVRLSWAAATFVAWLGWLAYLVATGSRPITLSRPQFLVADLDVVAQLSEAGGHPAPRVRLLRVWWSRQPQLPDGEIVVSNLPDAQVEGGWRGVGEYILPLVRVGPEYQIAPVPSSGATAGARDGRFRIYPRTEETLRQLTRLR